MGKDTFAYRPLESQRTIRTLLLQPGQAGQEVSCSLQHASLDHNRPKYEALSYAWGDVLNTRQICVDGRTATITASLYSALAQFRHPTHPRLLWADALCINQKDTAEKTVQVQLMADVYRYAVQVLVWLGPDEAGLEEFLPTLHAASGLISAIEARYNNEPEAAIEMQRKMMRLGWEPILELFLRPWFTRKWVVQEVALAKHVVMCCGNIWFPFHTLGMITLALVDWPVSAGLMAQWDKKYSTGFFNAYFLYSVHRNKVNNCEEGEDILNCLVRTKLFQCSVPHDHIYGLLGLLDTFGASLKPDYECSAADAFSQFAIWNLVEEQRPEVLCIASKPDGQIGLPSWVPDLSNMQDIHPIANHTLRLFSAGGQQAPKFSVSTDRKTLSCPGRIIDTIENYTQCVSEMPLPEDIPECLVRRRVTRYKVQSACRTLFWLQACERLAAENTSGLLYNDDGSNDGNTHGKTRLSPDRFKQFWRTILCGLHFIDGGYHRPKPSVGTTFARYFDLLRDTCSESRYKQVSGSELWKCALVIESTIDMLSVRRKFCTTKAGRLGQLPKEAQRGDQVCILQGVQVPFVVRKRPQGHGYVLIGECYLNGVMDGEEYMQDAGGVIEVQLY
ncbi:unnamed protein product [Clonostachys byssicola]|uniref:Heterokaryon incompatibility domain-containing protein n=1 Tax=Clonostachys byssicola TaxID=160290 RepID=A0A9N9Y5K4_9HYPO|nr:unnamed protein product [Clonostachys byssicola]